MHIARTYKGTLAHNATRSHNNYQRILRPGAKKCTLFNDKPVHYHSKWCVIRDSVFLIQNLVTAVTWEVEIWEPNQLEQISQLYAEVL